MIMKSLAAAALAAGIGAFSMGLGATDAAAHGCHRGAQDGLQGWHRHVGPNCRTVSAGPAYRNPYAACRTQCRYVGPIKQCRRVCNDRW